MCRASRSVLVTGGARRIGRAVCETLAEAGWRVVVHVRRPDDKDAAALAKSIGGVFVSEDLAHPLAAAQLFQKVCNLVPDLSAIVNNASVFSPSASLPPDAIETMFRVNSETPDKLTTLLGLRLMEHPPFSGSVVNLIDAAVLRPLSGICPQNSGLCPHDETPYIKSKLKIYESTIKNARLFASSIRVNGVAPGPVLPPADSSCHVPGGEILLPNRPAPQDVADTVAFLLDAKSVTGQIIAVDSGMSLV